MDATPSAPRKMFRGLMHILIAIALVLLYPVILAIHMTFQREN